MDPRLSAYMDAAQVSNYDNPFYSTRISFGI